jgi:hypothetical protein
MTKTKFLLPGLWVVVLGLRVASNPQPGSTLDIASLVLSWGLTFGIVVLAGLSLFVFVSGRLEASREGQRFADGRVVRNSLICGLAVGLVLRVIAWGQESQTAIGVVGAVLLLGSAIGIFAYYCRRAVLSRSHSGLAFFDEPLVMYGLLALCVVTVAFRSIVKPGGVLTAIAALLFWVSALALIVYVVVRRWTWCRKGAVGGAHRQSRHNSM